MNISSTYLLSLLGGFGVALLLHPPKSDDKNVEEMFTKCSTAQSFIWTEMTTYRIGTLTTTLTPIGNTVPLSRIFRPSDIPPVFL